MYFYQLLGAAHTLKLVEKLFGFLTFCDFSIYWPYLTIMQGFFMFSDIKPLNNMWNHQKRLKMVKLYFNKLLGVHSSRELVKIHNSNEFIKTENGVSCLVSVDWKCWNPWQLFSCFFYLVLDSSVVLQNTLIDRGPMIWIWLWLLVDWQ